jgi:hypothetical protein
LGFYLCGTIVGARSPKTPFCGHYFKLERLYLQAQILSLAYHILKVNLPWFSESRFEYWTRVAFPFLEQATGALLARRWVTISGGRLVRPSGVCLAACRIEIHSVITVCRGRVGDCFFPSDSFAHFLM